MQLIDLLTIYVLRTFHSIIQIKKAFKSKETQFSNGIILFCTLSLSCENSKHHTNVHIYIILHKWLVYVFPLRRRCGANIDVMYVSQIVLR